MALKKKKYDIFNDSLESYYWIGFLLADGHFSKETTIVLKVHIDDLDHIEKYKKFTKTDNITKIYYSVSKKFKCSSPTAKITICDGENVKNLCEKFDIKSNKTEFPPDIKTYDITDDQLLSLIIGFIDGDGCIYITKHNPKGTMRIKVHSSWLENLKIMEEHIRVMSGVLFKLNLSKINNQGYASLMITKIPVLIYLKQFIIINNLPALTRKWDKINIDNF